jgi:hypothetical protein
MKTCGECEHWEQAKPYAYGNCLAPVPAWTAGEGRNLISPKSEMAEDCDCFTPRQVKDQEDAK